MATHYRCSRCGEETEVDQPLWRCHCEGPLSLVKDIRLARRDIRTQDHSLWRYGAVLPAAAFPGVTLGEGWTPLISGACMGEDVLLKLDFLMPSGSFKDRGTAVMISYLRNVGVRAVLEDSSGNAGASIASYAAAAGLDCTIFVPNIAPRSKIVQIAATGASIRAVAGSRQDVADRALEAAKSAFYASHNWHPFFLEGTKTLAYELWEQLGFRAPGNVVVPLGYGSNVLGCHIGFTELLEAGEIERVPRIFGVQAENCAPFLTAQNAGAGDGQREMRPTIADGIAAQRPVRTAEVLAAISASDGTVIGVSEAAITAAFRDLARAGLFVEPTSATVAAAWSRLLADDVIGRRESTVLVLTGSGLKAVDATATMLEGDPPA